MLGANTDGWHVPSIPFVLDLSEPAFAGDRLRCCRSDAGQHQFSFGLARRAQLVDLVRIAVHRYGGVAYDDIHLASPVADGRTVDRASQRSLSVLALPSSIVVFLLSWWCLKQFRAALVVFGVASLSQGAALALVHYSGETMNALLIVLPPLIQVLVTIVMTLVQGGWWAGIAAMIPNVFPVVILFGVLGWFRAALDIGSVNVLEPWCRHR